MHRVESSESTRPQRLRGLFYGPTGLRAGWRLFIFIAIALGLLTVKDVICAKTEMASHFLSFSLRTGLWPRLRGEESAITAYRGKNMFGGQFWQGAVLGFGSITALLACLRIAGAFKFGDVALHGTEIRKRAALYCFLFLAVGFKEEFQYRGYAWFTLSTGIGWWPENRPARRRLRVK